MSKSADAFRTISEVASELGVPKHVLRFWEIKFAHIRPMKRGGGRRLYRPEDMALLFGIRHLLHFLRAAVDGDAEVLIVLLAACGAGNCQNQRHAQHSIRHGMQHFS